MPSLQPETKTNWSSVSAPWWPEVWIVGGGPSARGFRWPVGFWGFWQQILVINDATYLSLPPNAPTAVFTADPRWHHRHMEWAMFKRHGLGRSFDEYFACLDAVEGVIQVQYLLRDYHNVLSADPAKLSIIGGNSGWSAINLAVLKRAKLIHLIGFDMVAESGPDVEKFREWAPRFREMRPILDRLGVRVINHNKASAIDAFEFAS